MSVTLADPQLAQEAHRAGWPNANRPGTAEAAPGQNETISPIGHWHSKGDRVLNAAHARETELMPTDLPPDYKPKPVNDPNDPRDPNTPGSTPAYPPTPGEDSPGEPIGVPQPGPGRVPGPGPDVIDPPGWSEPPITPGGVPVEIPTPAGTPTF